MTVNLNVIKLQWGVMMTKKNYFERTFREARGVP